MAVLTGLFTLGRDAETLVTQRRHLKAFLPAPKWIQAQHESLGLAAERPHR